VAWFTTHSLGTVVSFESDHSHLWIRYSFGSNWGMIYDFIWVWNPIQDIVWQSRDTILGLRWDKHELIMICFFTGLLWWYQVVGSTRFFLSRINHKGRRPIEFDNDMLRNARTIMTQPWKFENTQLDPGTMMVLYALLGRFLQIYQRCILQPGWLNLWTKPWRKGFADMKLIIIRNLS
jgi:hypothetical protein